MRPMTLGARDVRRTRDVGADTVPREGHTVAAPRLELTVECEGGTDADRTVILDGELVRVGSHSSNDVVLNDPEVSRFHCRISRSDLAWRLSDTTSLNGTRLHGVRLRDADLPAPECVLELGRSRVRIRELQPGGQMEVVDRANFGDLYGTSFSMRRLFASLVRVAQSDSTALIEGDSGTGKELVAAEIVRRGPLTKHDWPGNVRELRNFVDRTVTLQRPGSSARSANRQTADAMISPPQTSSAVDLDIAFRDAKDRAISLSKSST